MEHCRRRKEYFSLQTRRVMLADLFGNTWSLLILDKPSPSDCICRLQSRSPDKIVIQSPSSCTSNSQNGGLDSGSIFLYATFGRKMGRYCDTYGVIQADLRSV